MQTVLGFGGFFFKARDPEALARWYEGMLGVTRASRENGYEPWHQAAGPTAFTPFATETSMFPNTSYMLNFRFATLSDPEGNPIQLWQP